MSDVQIQMVAGSILFVLIVCLFMIVKFMYKRRKSSPPHVPAVDSLTSELEKKVRELNNSIQAIDKRIKNKLDTSAQAVDKADQLLKQLLSDIN